MQTAQSVVIEPPALDQDAKGYMLSTLMFLAMRTLLIWGAIAILIPGFGITFWMVLVALVGLNALRGPGRYALVHSTNRVARTKRATSLISAPKKASDDILLVSRS